jgi:hypothetical protein
VREQSIPSLPREAQCFALASVKFDLSIRIAGVGSAAWRCSLRYAGGSTIGLSATSARVPLPVMTAKYAQIGRSATGPFASQEWHTNPVGAFGNDPGPPTVAGLVQAAARGSRSRPSLQALARCHRVSD